MKLTKEDILRKVNLPTMELEIPEWEGSISIKGLTTSQRIQLAEYAQKNNSQVDLVCKLISFSIIEPELSEKEIKELIEADFRGIERIINAIYSLNGMTEEAVKEIQESFLATQRGSSISS